MTEPTQAEHDVAVEFVGKYAYLAASGRPGLFTSKVAQLLAQVRAETLEQAAKVLDYEVADCLREGDIPEANLLRALAEELRALSTRRDSPEGGA